MPGAIVFGGGGNGIGTAICRLLARDGYSVVVADSNMAAAEEIAGGLPLATAVLADTTNSCQVMSAVAAAVDLRAIVINAGAISSGNVDWLSLAELERLERINVHGPFNVFKAAAARSEQLACVLISSMAAVKSTGHCGYEATKAAGAAMAKAAATLRPGLRVNVILPGFIDGPFSRRCVDEAGASWGSREDFVRRIVPARRQGRPEEVAEAAIFLLSDAASYVNGVCLPVDGGLSVR